MEERRREVQRDGAGATWRRVRARAGTTSSLTSKVDRAARARQRSNPTRWPDPGPDGLADGFRVTTRGDDSAAPTRPRRLGRARPRRRDRAHPRGPGVRGSDRSRRDDHTLPPARRLVTEDDTVGEADGIGPAAPTRSAAPEADDRASRADHCGHPDPFDRARLDDAQFDLTRLESAGRRPARRHDVGTVWRAALSR